MASQPNRPGPKHRGSHINPQNRFETVHTHEDFAHFEHEPKEIIASNRHIKTEYLEDMTQTIVSTNNSPDLHFNYSVNPYRGCVHGCAYCYARPTHEYLSQNGGLDFESKIFVKHLAPKLFRDFLARPKWKPEPIYFSGVTDCYQPCEQKFELTRKCLQVAVEARQPIGIITKNSLVTRDLDLLAQLAKYNAIHVMVSLTTLDPILARSMEPQTSSPASRLRTVQKLAEANIPVGVMVAPIIPGLNDSEIPQLLQAASKAGAWVARHQILRLPLTVKPVFEEWLQRTRPDEKPRIESRIRACRDGKISSAKFTERMQGTGPMARHINQTFKVFAKKYHLQDRLPTLQKKHFIPPRACSGQQFLF